jgi:reverse gyrase
MPRKKQDKSREERAVESSSMVDPLDVKTRTEKLVREKVAGKLIDTIEKQVKSNEKNTEKGSVSKTSKRPTKKELEKVESFNVVKKKIKRSKVAKEYHPPKTKLREGGYELIITEKPQAALKIANALGNSVQRNINKVPYYEVEREGSRIVVACAVGHLFTLKQKNGGSNIPVFDILWIPNFIARKGDFTKRYYDTILKLTKDAGSITIATDYDVEGEVIGMNVMKYICNQKDASRMKFSTLTQKELNNAYEKKSKNLNWGQAIAG